jgi:hypothetical protein
MNLTGILPIPRALPPSLSAADPMASVGGGGVANGASSALASRSNATAVANKGGAATEVTLTPPTSRWC